MTPRRYEDVAGSVLAHGDDLDLVKLAVQLGLKSSGTPGAAFAPCLLLWPSKVVVATTSMMLDASVEACIDYLRAAVPLSDDLEAYAIVSDARALRTAGASEEIVAVELASHHGGFRIVQRHVTGRPVGVPEVHELFESPLLTTPSEAELDLAELAFDAADGEDLPLALVLEEGEPTLLRLEDGGDDAAIALFGLAEHLFESCAPTTYAMAYERVEADATCVRVEVGTGRGWAFVFEESGGDGTSLRLLGRSAALWKKIEKLRAKRAEAAGPPCRTK